MSVDSSSKEDVEEYRIEHDTMGESSAHQRAVARTDQRAVENYRSPGAV
jgi:hypothetical protein